MYPASLRPELDRLFPSLKSCGRHLVTEVPTADDG